MPDDKQKAERYLQTARKIRRATGVPEIASAVIAGVTSDAPVNVSEWQRRTVVRRAVETALRCLQISIMQRAVASPELASDSCIDSRRHIVRLLGAVATTQDCMAIAELAVSAVTPERAAESIVRAAGELRRAEVDAPLAVCSLSGRLLVSSPALEYADVRGLSEADLNRLLLEATAPIRRACQAADACRIGELRFSKLVPAHSLAIVAHLDGSGEGAPVIRLLLCDTTVASAPSHTSPSTEPDDAYPARLLRRLVS
jgi:hypothetical protein